jgi:hypothetical protein
MNNAKKRILCAGFAILLIILCSVASATEADPTPIPLIQPTPLPPSFAGGEVHYTTVWKIVSPGINTDALLLETFGSADPEPQSEERENHSLFWPADAKGVPFCSIGHRLGAEEIQTEFDIYRHSDSGEERVYYYKLDVYNVLPELSGFSADRASETCNQAVELVTRLGLVQGSVTAVPVSFSTLGNMEGTTPCRKVILEERLEGLPIRWSEEVLLSENMDNPGLLLNPCYAEVVYSDEDGLLTLEGSWCAFEPMERTSSILSPEEAILLFRKARLIDNDSPASALERCYFLSANGKDATATLSYRFGNNYLNAVDGAWLQIGK